jgi:phosphopantothenoylcysteine decarboxylase
MSSNQENNQINLIIGVTASVATIKLYELIDLLFSKFDNKINICVIATQNSQHFLPDFEHKFRLSETNSLKNRLELMEQTKRENQNDVQSKILFAFTDQDEWSSWTKRGDPVLHIELRKWSDILLIAPLDANTMAKISNGICDNLLTSLVRAWDLENLPNKKMKPVIVCPAMNTFMYEHPLTEKQLNILKNDFNFKILKPIEKTLICGDKGIGAMASIDTIAEFLLNITNN